MAMGNHVSAFQTGRVSMSNRQYVMLRTIDAASRSTVRVSEIMGWHQNTLGSLKKKRNFIVETPDKHGVKITPEGRAALRAYETADFYRKHSSLHFAGCLSLEPPANLLAEVQKRKPAGHWKAGDEDNGHAHAA